MGDRIIPSGHLVLTWQDKAGNIIKQKELHNQITNAGLDLAFNRGLGSLLKAGADVFGQVYTYDSLMGSYRGAQYHTLDSAIHVGLLNLGNKQNGLNIGSSIANFYSEDFNSLDNVIGFAGINLTPASNGKEGQLGLSRGSLVPASWTRGMRWVFPVNVAGGTFDTLILTGRGILTTPYPVSNGEISSICIDKVNTKDTNFVSLSNAYCPPGVTGVTGNNEILLNFNDGANSQWKFNMDTGEVTAVATGTPFFCPIEVGIDDWFIEGNYLYTVENTGATSSGTTQVHVWDITTQSEVDTFNLSGSTSTYGRHYKFLKYNDKVYVTVNSINQNSSSTRRCWTLNKGAGGQYTSATNGTSIQATIGVTLPTGLPLSQVALGNFGSNYLVYIGDAAMIVSSLENIQGTLLGVIPFVLPGMCGYTGNNSPGFLSIGAPGATAAVSVDEITDNNIGAHWFVGDLADEVSLYLEGICWTPNGHWGTMTSYFKLSSPESKSDDNILTVDWYYDFSGGTSESGTVS